MFFQHRSDDHHRAASTSKGAQAQHDLEVAKDKKLVEIQRKVKPRPRIRKDVAARPNCLTP